MLAPQSQVIVRNAELFTHGKWLLKETDRLGEYFMRAVNDGSLVDAIKPLPFKMI